MLKCRVIQESLTFLAEILINLSSCQLLFMFVPRCSMFFYHSSQLRCEFELEFVENMNLTYHLGPLQPRRASDAWLVAGAQDVRSPKNPRDDTSRQQKPGEIMEPTRARPKMEKKATVFACHT